MHRALLEIATKNEKKERDPEMPQARKGNQWYFGAKTHIGVDLLPESKLPATTVDWKVLQRLLRLSACSLYHRAVCLESPRLRNYQRKRVAHSYFSSICLLNLRTVSLQVS